MKETNMEHFRGEIEEFVENNRSFGVKNGVPVDCHIVGCSACELLCNHCDIGTIKRLMSEYKPEPVLTAREKHFVEFAQEGWLARDDDGELWWYKLKPEKKKEHWSIGPVTYSFKGILDFEQHFRFITWEDEEPWAVEDLRKLKVEGGEADETD